MPFFSIITPTYNRAHTLGMVFESLQAQKFKNFEWIIGDDGSDDDTQDLVKSFIKKAKFDIKYYKLKHGGKHNVLKAIKDYPSGEWILGLDSNDTLFDDNTLNDIKSATENLPKDKKYNTVGGCFGGQKGEKISKFDEEYIDVDIEKYLQYLTGDTRMINCCLVSR